MRKIYNLLIINEVNEIKTFNSLEEAINFKNKTIEEIEEYGYVIEDETDTSVLAVGDDDDYTMEIFENEIEDKTDGVVYNIYDGCNEQIIASLLFKDYMDYDERVKLQHKIDEIKDSLEEDWQYCEVFDELHKFYDFIELAVSEKSFEI